MCSPSFGSALSCRTSHDCDGDLKRNWLAETLAELDHGAIGKLLSRLRALTQIAAGFFVGSGAVEASCKTLIKAASQSVRSRLDSARGRCAIACLRSFKASGRWERLLGYGVLTQTRSA